MDLTPLFVQVLNKDKISLQKEKCKLFNRKKSLFSSKVLELVASITQMKDYLISNKKDYINIYNSFLSMASHMTDEERDQIDQDVQDFVKLCNDVIKILRVEIKSKSAGQKFEHEKNVIDLVEIYLKTIKDFHIKQKALRLRRNLDSQNFFRLNHSFINAVSFKPKRSSNLEVKNNSEQTNINKKSQPTFKIVNNLYNEIDTPSTSNVTQPLSREEIQLFKVEGNRIYEEMNSMSNEVKNVAAKLSEISKLQDVFSDNILKQVTDLDQLSHNTIMSTENIRSGNEQLRESMRKNAGFRVWVLFFITTLAFVILFLDWYNA